MLSAPNVRKSGAGPICPRCAVEMWLVRKHSIDQPNHDLRTFGCPKCDAVMTKVVTVRSRRARTKMAGKKRN